MEAIVSWSGGKDSCLALLRAMDQGISVKCLVTFVPADGGDFRAHPRSAIKKQALAMNLRHIFVSVAEPYDSGYEENLSQLRDAMGVRAVITGDIDNVANQPNWMFERCSKIGLETVRPLWKNNRDSLMGEILRRGIEARISWVAHPSIPSSWIGKAIDHVLLKDLKDIAATTGLDLCGENGEYHTIVTRAPIFGDEFVAI